MNILWFSWKDIKNPRAGGAEYNQNVQASALAKQGHKVIILTSHFTGSKKKEFINGYTVIRVGNRFSVYLAAFLYSKIHLSHWPDIIIEEINTIPFFTHLYLKADKRFLLVYQLCRKIWFYEFMFPFSLCGYIAEWFYMQLFKNHQVLTISKSTQKDLMRLGFKKNYIRIFPLSTALKTISSVKKKNDSCIILSFGSQRPMKQISHQIKAFELAKNQIPDLQLVIAGEHKKYSQHIRSIIHRSKYRKSITLFGKTNTKAKQLLFRKAHLFLHTAVKEGWGITIIEANSQGTPAIGYNTEGLRDSILHNKTGLLTKHNNPDSLSNEIIHLFKDKRKYSFLQNNAVLWSKKFTIRESCRQFQSLIFT